MLSFVPSPAPWDHRPAVSSPLSSSPIRAASPLSPIDEDSLPQRQTQSSPIQPPKFRRDDTRESRRRDFLQSVRQKSHDKAWQRRDIEGQFLKTSWLASLGRLSHDAPPLSETDLEEAAVFQQEPQQAPDEDDMMVDSRRDDAELEAMVASYEEHQLAPSQRPPSPTLSDPEYDDIFAELVCREQSQQNQTQPWPDQMDMSGDDGNTHV